MSEHLELAANGAAELAREMRLSAGTWSRYADLVGDDDKVAEARGRSEAWLAAARKVDELAEWIRG